MLGRQPACLSGALGLLVAMGAGVAPSHAQSPLTPNETLAHERTLLAESFASARLAVWQKRLNLQGWDISVVVSRADGLRPKTAGNVHWDPKKKTAVIRVLDPADYRLPLAATLQDIGTVHAGCRNAHKNVRGADGGQGTSDGDERLRSARRAHRDSRHGGWEGHDSPT